MDKNWKSIESELCQAGMPRRKTRFLIAGMLVSLPLHFLAFYSRPLWRAFCRMERDRAARDSKRSPEEHRAAIALANLTLAFESREPWAQVKPHLDDIIEDSERHRMAAAFALLYFYNGRFSEARDTALYNVAAASRWVQENPQAAKRARQLRRLTRDWYPRGHPNAVQPNATNSEWRQMNWRRSREAQEADNGAFRRYRDSRFAILLLDRVNGNTSMLEKLDLTRKEKNPVWPLGALNVELARKIGISELEIHAMLNEAESLQARVAIEDI